MSLDGVGAERGLFPEHSENRSKGMFRSPRLGFLWSESGAQSEPYVLLTTASPPLSFPHTPFPCPVLLSTQHLPHPLLLLYYICICLPIVHSIQEYRLQRADTLPILFKPVPRREPGTEQALNRHLLKKGILHFTSHKHIGTQGKAFLAISLQSGGFICSGNWKPEGMV